MKLTDEMRDRFAGGAVFQGPDGDGRELDGGLDDQAVLGAR